MPYRLTGKATVKTPDFKVHNGGEITDAQYKSLNAMRKKWFEKIAAETKAQSKKAKTQPKKSKTQPLPVEPPAEPPVKAE